MLDLQRNCTNKKQARRRCIAADLLKVRQLCSHTAAKAMPKQPAATVNAKTA